MPEHIGAFKLLQRLGFNHALRLATTSQQPQTNRFGARFMPLHATITDTLDSDTVLKLEAWSGVNPAVLSPSFAGACRAPHFMPLQP